MQIATIISLAGTVTCAGIFLVQKQWVLFAAFLSLTLYTVLDRVIRIGEIPSVVVESLPYVALALIVYEVLRKVVTK